MQTEQCLDSDDAEALKQRWSLRPLIEAYQRAASTALAELRLYLDTDDVGRLHSFVSWSRTADSERDKIQKELGW